VEFEKTGLVVPASTEQEFDLTGFFNRGLMYRIEVEETDGLVTEPYNITLYNRDTKLDSERLYQAENIPPTEIYRDPPGEGAGGFGILVEDADGTRELHLKIFNQDTVNQATFRIKLVCERMD